MNDRREQGELFAPPRSKQPAKRPNPATVEAKRLEQSRGFMRSYADMLIRERKAAGIAPKYKGEG